MSVGPPMFSITMPVFGVTAVEYNFNATAFGHNFARNNRDNAIIYICKEHYLENSISAPAAWFDKNDNWQLTAKQP